MTTRLTWLCFILITSAGIPQSLFSEEFKYLGQTPPDNTPVVFARGIISTEYQNHGVPAFSPDGKEVFWQINKQDDQNNWIISVMTMQRIEGNWTEPEVTPYGSGPVFSPDGKRLYFGSTEEGKNPYYADKQDDGWSEPKEIDLISRFPELKFAYNLSVTSSGTLYFLGYTPEPGLWNNYGIYRSIFINGQYTKPELLPENINVRGDILNWTPFIAPDESYLIYSSMRVKPVDEYGDLYISFRKADGRWTERINLGESINTKTNERFPAVSPDGKYLFFTRWTPDYDEDVFWVSAEIIDSIKATKK
ncbi:MAG: hypothetical protein R6W90_06215 [Ignavibacteriaceae bacterium]